MKRNVWSKVFLRLLVVAVGFSAISGLVYAAGIWLVPLVDGMDKRISAVCNPNAYVPGLDQLMRGVSDYTNFLIITPILSWLIAVGLFRCFPARKRLFLGLLVVETLVLAVFAARGKIWPNKTYMADNVLLVVSILVAFGAMAVLFSRMEIKEMRPLAAVFGLMFLSGLLTDNLATNPIKSAVARPRPLNDANRPWNEQLRIIPDEVLRGRNSFPSGHTSGTFALLTPLFWYVGDRRARAGLFGWCTLQGVSRVYTVAHFPFCCFMGGILGFSVGTLVFFALGGPSLRPALAPETQASA